MNDELKNIFENVNRWLIHAETKCAGVIALDVAVLAIVNEIEIPPKFVFLKATVMILFCLSLVIALVAVLPVEKKISVKKTCPKSVEENLLFYENIAQYSVEEYMTKLIERYFAGKKKIKEKDKDYIEEIVENSRITVRKQKIIAWALKISLLSIMILILCVIIA